MARIRPPRPALVALTAGWRLALRLGGSRRSRNRSPRASSRRRACHAGGRVSRRPRDFGPIFFIACSVRLAAPSGVETDSVLATASPPAARIYFTTSSKSRIAPATERMTPEMVHQHPCAAAGEFQSMATAIPPPAPVTTIRHRRSSVCSLLSPLCHEAGARCRRC